ncbi:MAG: hypothetical protein GX923_06830 [Clostridia bacterium]|mgnify:CR=1 FL=1|jgi:hypothetical protein|nr:hypothetical protein [Clostridia bacterium]
MNNFLKTILLTCIFVAVPCILYAQDTSISFPQNIEYIHRSFNVGRFFVELLGLGALTLLGLSLFETPLIKMNNWLTTNLGNVLLKGFLGWLALPFLIITLILTIVGIPIAFLAMFLIPVPLIIGLWVMGLFAGNKIAPFLKPEWQDNLLIKGILGVITIWLAIKAPFIGFLVLPVVAIIGLGIILDSKFGTGKPWFPKKGGNNDVN